MAVGQPHAGPAMTTPTMTLSSSARATLTIGAHERHRASFEGPPGALHLPTNNDDG
jgi:hypothetical protein